MWGLDTNFKSLIKKFFLAALVTGCNFEPCCQRVNEYPMFLQIAELLVELDLTTESLHDILSLFRSDFDNGLSADEQVRAKSSLKMLPTYVRTIPDGTESGDFLALDLGGTNFRVLLISVANGTVQMESDIYPLDEALMNSDAETLFDYIAGCISLFVKKNKVQGKSLPLGFTFSFPVKQLSLTSGLLIKWTKGFTASGVEHNDVVKLLKEALVRNGVVSWHLYVMHTLVFSLL